MMAFVVAGIVFVVTVLAALFVLLGNGMSDNPSNNSSAGFKATFWVGTIISILIAGSHWISWSW